MIYFGWQQVENKEDLVLSWAPSNSFFCRREMRGFQWTSSILVKNLGSICSEIWKLFFFLWGGKSLWVIIQKVKLEYIFSCHCSIVLDNTFADVWASLLCSYHRWFASWNCATTEWILFSRSLYHLTLIFFFWVLTSPSSVSRWLSC